MQEKPETHKANKLDPTLLRCIMHAVPTSVSRTLSFLEELQFGCLVSVKVMLSPQHTSHIVTASRRPRLESQRIVGLILFRSSDCAAVERYAVAL